MNTTINYSTIVENIENQLNTLAAQAGAPFTFEIEIVSNISECQAVQIYKNDKPIMRGVFVPSTGDIVPIQGLYSFTAGANLIFACKDEYRGQLFSILNDWSVEQAGAGGVLTVEEDKIAYLISTNTPGVGNEQVLPGMGQGVPMNVILSFQFIKNGAIGNSCVWELDGENLTDLLNTIDKNKTINADARENDEVLTSVQCSQSIDFRFTLPYINTPAISSLVQELFSTEELAKVHTLSYYDNVAIPEANKVTYNVTVQAISLKNQKGTVSSIDVVFAIVQTED